MNVVRAKHYAETEQRMTGDRIIQSMAWELWRAGHRSDELVHEGTDTVTHEWSLRINAGYRAKGGTDGGHIGAAPTALLMVVRRIEAYVAKAAAGEQIGDFDPTRD